MKHENRKAYLAPSAEVICLAPSENIAAWTFKNDSGGWLWNSDSQFTWGAEPPSTTNLLWYDFDFGTDEIDSEK